jgi:heterodisulfide reductase subunit A
LLLELDRLYPTGECARDLVECHVTEVSNHPNIEVLTSAELVEAKGYVGSFELTVRSRAFGMDLPVHAGVIVVATGAQEFKPEGMHRYGQDSTVITQLELEHHLTSGSLPSTLATVVMIQCVGARDEKHAYCGRTCCLTAIKNAIQLKERVPGVEVHILYRDIEVYGAHFEEYYSAARDLGVVFSRYRYGDGPQVNLSTRRVIVYDEMLGANISIPFDMVILSAPMIPRPGTQELAKLLKIPVDEYGFFLEAHVKLRPLDFATDGIYLCGSAHWPAHLDEIIGQAYGAAARAATVLSKDQIRASGVVAKVNEYLCRGCKRCTEVCEFGAVQLVELEADRVPAGQVYGQHEAGRMNDTRTVARVNPVLCKGCGACAVVCPTCAMQALHFTDSQVTAMVQAAIGG